MSQYYVFLYLDSQQTQPAMFPADQTTLFARSDGLWIQYSEGASWHRFRLAPGSELVLCESSHEALNRFRLLLAQCQDESKAALSPHRLTVIPFNQLSKDP